jgi:SAM-dependent methyltransferase
MYQQMADVENKHWWFVARRTLFAEALYANQHAKDRNSDDTIVDIGCGTGGNFALLRGYGEVIGLELDATAAAMAGAHGRVIRGGDTDCWPIAANSVGAFTAFDVLEHIVDDRAAVRNLFASLKPGGRLILSVPAYGWLWSRHDELLHHQRRYLAREISSLALSAGFRVEYISYHNCILFPLSIVLRLLSRLSGGRLGVDENRVPSPLINGILRMIYSLERHLVKRRIRLPFGLSIIAVLCKPGVE